jgi:aspartyl-tRNA(Asn)/glutamyl-tRNA(Gln) amidotransferase subunit A
MTAAEIARRIRLREVSPVEAVEAALARISELNDELRAFITVTAGDALQAAREAEKALISGCDVGPLHGVPVAIKDIIETAGVRTTCGSRILRDYVPAEDATVVRLLKRAGAIMVGKTNTHEFAFGPTTVNPHYGACRNPHNPACVSGGSSGGSAVAAATGMVPLAVGTDTGGSIRIPAACCGIFGIKPTYGLVSKAGIFPLSWSLDHPGPLARTAEDAALALTVMAGPDPRDPATVTGRSPDDYLASVERAQEGLRGLAVGIPEGWLECRVEPGVAGAVNRAVSALEGLGASVRPVGFPAADPMMLANRLIVLAEAAAYHMPTLRARPEDYGADVRVRLELGQYLMAIDYLAGQRLRAELCQAAADAMRGVDLIVTPGLPVAAPYIGQDHVDWADGRETVPDALIRFPAPFNITGQPAACVPCGFSAGRPVALQIVGRWFEEGTVLRAAAALQAAGM